MASPRRFVALTAARCKSFCNQRNEKGLSEADFPLRWLQKDLHLAAVSAYETGVAMPLTNAAKEIYRLAIREGHGGEDFSAIYDYLAETRGSVNGISIPSEP